VCTVVLALQDCSSAAPEHRGIAEETVGQRLSSARQSILLLLSYSTAGKGIVCVASL